MYDINQNSRSIGVLTVATNIYIDYWKDMIFSFDQAIDNKYEVVSHLFTDQPNQAMRIGSKLKNIKLKVHQVDSYVWPEATLLRYKMFSNQSSLLREDILMHLDADMFVHSNPIPLILESCSISDINLVSHPGYWRKSFNRRSISEVVKDLKDKSRLMGSIQKKPRGSWETNPTSMAYVPEENRSHYVCGGTWFGNRTALLDLISDLAVLTEIDISNGIIPIWHDESMLNRWASLNPHGLLSPSLCYVDEYRHLNSIPRVIQAVTKSNKTR
jgi:hypothetical protein